MDPILLGGLIGGGAGLLKSIFGAGDVDKYNDLQAQTARYSPWTGMKPEGLKSHNFVGDTLQGGMTGAAMGQSVAKNNMWSKFLGGGGAAAAAAPIGGLTYMDGVSPWDSMTPQANRFNLGVL